MELTVGLFKTNSCVAGSYVAVVSSPLRWVPSERQGGQRPAGTLTARPHGQTKESVKIVWVQARTTVLRKKLSWFQESLLRSSSKNGLSCYLNFREESENLEGMKSSEECLWVCRCLTDRNGDATIVFITINLLTLPKLIDTLVSMHE